MLFGAIFFVPLLAIGVNAGVGAVRDHFSDFDINDGFIKQVRSLVSEGHSALFLLLDAMSNDKVASAFKVAPHLEIIESHLSLEQETELIEPFA